MVIHLYLFDFFNRAAESVNLINEYFLRSLDGHSILVTPDPVPNSEVKLDMFVFVLSLMGTHEAVCFIFPYIKLGRIKMREIITQIFKDSIKVKSGVIETLIPNIQSSAYVMIEALKRGNKLLICGNGGSAADAQHFSAELVMRFEKDRPSLAAIALTTDTSNITACGNDYGYDSVFKRQIEGLGKRGDVLVAITTSGNSKNLIEALKIAKQKNMKTICLNGKMGGKINDLNVDFNLIVRGNNTARIQESHITIIHTWCKLIEDTIFAN